MGLKRLSVLSLAILLAMTLSACKNGKSAIEQQPEQQTNDIKTVDKIGQDIETSKDLGKEITPNNKTEDNQQKQTSKENEQQQTNIPVDQKNTSQISNKKHAWGLVRVPNNAQPRIDSDSGKLVDKYNGIYLGNKDKKIVYLTFDEGYENGYTSIILDTLKKQNVKATFFITMPYLKEQLPLVKRMLAEGHIVGNHTVNHPSMPEVIDDKKLEEEILGLDRVFYEKTKSTMKFIRPPKGEFSERTLSISRNLGYTSVFWSFAYADWDPNKQKGVDYARNMVINNLHNGEVILLHAVSKDNAEGLDQMLTDIKAKGYTIESLDKFQK